MLNKAKKTLKNSKHLSFADVAAKRRPVAKVAIARSAGKKPVKLGVQYIHPQKKPYPYPNEKFAPIFSKIGTKWSKIQYVPWSMIEPNPPVDGIHKYDWSRLDSLIRIYQEAGFNDFDIVLESYSDWGIRELTTTEKITRLQKTLPWSLPPKQEHWEDYTNFIYNVVERYDMDGKKDMPGLKYPILHYEIESEVQGTFHWAGTIEEYQKVLEVAYSAAKKASSDAKIILSGLALLDVVQPDEEPEKRINKYLDTIRKKLWLKQIKNIRKMLSTPEYFDIIEFHAYSDYFDILTTAKWLRNEMKKKGYVKPIMAGDAVFSPVMQFGPVNYPLNPFRMTSMEVLEVLSDKSHKDHTKVMQWYRAEQSRILLKKIVMAADAGLEGISFGFLVEGGEEFNKKFKPFIKTKGSKLDISSNP